MRDIYRVFMATSYMRCYRCDGKIKPLDVYMVLLDRNICPKCVKAASKVFDDASEKLLADIKDSTTDELQKHKFARQFTIKYRNNICKALIASGIPKIKISKEHDVGVVPNPAIGRTGRHPSADIIIGGEDYFSKQVEINIHENANIVIRRFFKVESIYNGKVYWDRKCELVAEILGANPKGIEETVRIVTEILKQAEQEI